MERDVVSHGSDFHHVPEWCSKHWFGDPNRKGAHSAPTRTQAARLAVAHLTIKGRRAQSSAKT